MGLPDDYNQNAFVECLKGKFRNEYLIQQWFRTLEEAKYKIDLWREHYNTVRPHSWLNYLPPLEYPKEAAQYKKSHRADVSSSGERAYVGKNCNLYDLQFW